MRTSPGKSTWQLGALGSFSNVNTSTHVQYVGIVMTRRKSSVEHPADINVACQVQLSFVLREH